MRVKKQWLGPVGIESAISMALRQNHSLSEGTAVKLEPIWLQPYVPEERVNLVASGRASEELPEHSEPHSLLLRLHWETCPNCLESRHKTLPYKVQLRSDIGVLSPRDRTTSDVALNEALYLHPSRFERKEVEGGIDIEFENPRAVGELLAILRRRRRGKEHSSSEGILRLPSGGQLVKRTYVFRFSSLKPGEIVRLTDGEVRVEELTKRRAVVTELKTNKRSTLPIELLLDAKSATSLERSDVA